MTNETLVTQDACERCGAAVSIFSRTYPIQNGEWASASFHLTGHVCSDILQSQIKALRRNLMVVTVSVMLVGLAQILHVLRVIS